MTDGDAMLIGLAIGALFMWIVTRDEQRK